MSTFDEINQRFQEALRGIEVRDTERAVTRILIQVGANTAPMIPMATSALANSMHRIVERSANGWYGQIGFGPKMSGGEYFQRRGPGDPETVNYALHVHNAPGTLLGTDTPRYPKRLGTVWGPNGEPRFLEKGIEQTIPQLRGILREEYSE